MSKVVLEYLKQRLEMDTRERNVLLDLMILSESPIYLDRSAMPGVDVTIPEEVKQAFPPGVHRGVHRGVLEEKLEEKKAKRPYKRTGTKSQFDANMTTSPESMRKMTKWLQQKSWQKKLDLDQSELYQTLVKGQSLIDMGQQHKDKILMLYKDVGVTLYGDK